MVVTYTEFGKAESLSNGEWKLTLRFDKSINASTKAYLLELHGGVGYVAIKKELFNTQERDAIESLKAEKHGKSQSQRIRNVLYRLYEKDDKGFRTFDDFYTDYTEKIIEHFKQQIEL